MARSFQQVLAEVSAKSDPQRKVVLDQVAALPGQQLADEAGLDAKKDRAFEDILGGARRRGLGFAGIPLGDQAKYAATDYAPAVANLKAGYNTRRGTLEGALADIGRGDYTTANDIFGQDRSFEEQQRQFNLSYKLQQQQAADARKAAAAAFSPSIGGGKASSGTSENKFLGNDDFRGRLAYEATKGNADAKFALRYAGNNGRYDGPVKDVAEYSALKRIGVIGNYYLPGLDFGGGESGLHGLPAGIRF